MDCPRCHSALSTTTVHDVKIETCPKCGGMFLDHGVLDRIAEPHEGDLEFSSLDHETFSHDDAHGATGCLRCDGRTMKKVEFNIYTGIILDYCEHCRAFWLDRKEMDRINEEVRSLSETTTETVAPAMMWFAHFIWSLPR